MINPKIKEEYGESGFKLMEGLCEVLTDEEKNSIYAAYHHISGVANIPNELTSDRDDLVESICDKIEDFMAGIYSDTILMCYEHYGRGIKVCIT